MFHFTIKCVEQIGYFSCIRLVLFLCFFHRHPYMQWFFTEKLFTLVKLEKSKEKSALSFFFKRAFSFFHPPKWFWQSNVNCLKKGVLLRPTSNEKIVNKSYSNWGFHTKLSNFIHWCRPHIQFNTKACCPIDITFWLISISTVASVPFILRWAITYYYYILLQPYYICFRLKCVQSNVEKTVSTN